jgi:hypothetical protein
MQPLLDALFPMAETIETGLDAMLRAREQCNSRLEHWVELLEHWNSDLEQ